MSGKSVFLFFRFLRPLACGFAAGLLFASSAHAAPVTRTIGYDPVTREYDPTAYYKTGSDLSLSQAAVYVPFAFDFGGDFYSLDSVQLLFTGTGDFSLISLLVTETLGSDLSAPPVRATFSATDATEFPVFTFHADAPSLLASGTIYYLRLTSPVGQDPQWVWNGWSPGGVPPADSGDPHPHHNDPPYHPDNTNVPLTPLLALNPTGGLTFRLVGSNSYYMDRSGAYGISITATAVPEPAAFSLIVVGSALGAALLFRRKRPA